MGKFAAFKLPLKAMPVGTQDFEYEITTEFFKNMESEDIRKGSVRVVLQVKHASDAYYLDFKINGIVNILCDRCLDDMEHEVDTTYHLTVKYGEEYSEETDDVLVIPESDNYLNIAYIIYDTIALTVPLKHVHPTGKCNRAMCAQLKKHAARNLTDGEGEEELLDDDNDVILDKTEEDNIEIDPRWEALKDINDNN